MRERKIKKPLCIILAFLTLIGMLACTSENKNMLESSVTQEEQTDLVSGEELFSIIYASNANASIRTIARKLKVVLEDFYGHSIRVSDDISLPNGGTYCAARLSKDLSHIVGEVHTLFNAYDGYQSNEPVSDAAFVYRTQSGQLLLLWSNFDYDRGKGYRVYIARSESGNILGPWTHDQVYLYEKDMDTIYALYDGGHPSIFKDPNGKLMLNIHSPSVGFYNESLNLIPVEDTGTTLQIEKYR